MTLKRLKVFMRFLMSVILLGSQGIVPAWAAAGDGSVELPTFRSSGVASKLVGIKTIGDLEREVVKSIAGPYADFFKTQFKGRQMERLDIRRVASDEYALRVDNKLVTLEVSAFDSPLRINKRLIEFNWNGRPEDELKKIEAVLPAQARQALPNLPGQRLFLPSFTAALLIAVSAGEDAHALYLQVAVIAFAVAAVAYNVSACTAIEEAVKKCEKFEKMTDEEKEKLEDRPSLKETPLKYSRALAASHFFCAKEKSLRECVVRRGIRINGNEPSGGEANWRKSAIDASAPSQ